MYTRVVNKAYRRSWGGVGGIGRRPWGRGPGAHRAGGSRHRAELQTGTISHWASSPPEDAATDPHTCALPADNTKVSLTFCICPWTHNYASFDNAVHTTRLTVWDGKKKHSEDLSTLDYIVLSYLFKWENPESTYHNCQNMVVLSVNIRRPSCAEKRRRKTQIHQSTHTMSITGISYGHQKVFAANNSHKFWI